MFPHRWERNGRGVRTVPPFRDGPLLLAAGPLGGRGRLPKEASGTASRSSRSTSSRARLAAPPRSRTRDPYREDASWTQNPGEITFRPFLLRPCLDGSWICSCQVYFDIRLDGQQVGGGQLQTDSQSPVEVSESLGAGGQDRPADQPAERDDGRDELQWCMRRRLTIDSTWFRVLDFGEIDHWPNAGDSSERSRHMKCPRCGQGSPGTSLIQAAQRPCGLRPLGCRGRRRPGSPDRPRSASRPPSSLCPARCGFRLHGRGRAGARELSCP